MTLLVAKLFVLERMTTYKRPIPLHKNSLVTSTSEQFFLDQPETQNQRNHDPKHQHDERKCHIKIGEI